VKNATNGLAAEFIAGVRELPALSSSTSDLLRHLEREDVTMVQVIRILARDPLLSAKVVRLANSPYYGGLSSANLDQALIRIGMKELRTIALTSAVVEAFPDLGAGFNLRAFWRHCVASGLGAYSVAHSAPVLQESGRERAGGAFYMCGLLHHLGILLHVLYLPKEFQTAWSLCEADAEPLYVAERQVLGFDHAESAACLLERWGFPPAVRSAVRYHHQPEKAEEEHRFAARILHVSAMLCHAVPGETASFEGHVDGFDEAAWFGLGFDAAALETMQGEVVKAVEAADRFVQELFR
jgi:HD-like signal output (HDOD) protein